MAKAPAGLLGRLAVDQGLITMDQLASATHEQARADGKERLGEVLVGLGFLENGQLESLLAIQKADIKRIEDAREARAATAPIPDEDRWVVATQAQLEAQATSRGPGASRQEDNDRTTRDWLTTVLRQAVQWSATDIHLQGGSPVNFRVAGTLHGPSDPLTSKQVDNVAKLIIPERSVARFEAGAAVVFGMTVDGAGRMRVQAVWGERGVEVGFRRLPKDPPLLGDLALPGELARVAVARHGLMLIAGPPRTGKTCAMAALVRIINEERRERIVCVERPVEIVHTPDRCLVTQLEVGRHVPTWAAGLQTAVDADADVVALGELPTLELATKAADLADSGRLVLAGATPAMAKEIGGRARAVVTLRTEHSDVGDSLIHVATVHGL
jgi:type II secretory ATPase GspE/PulE/Tfp pilus assembly ATPase PilB-like protein